MKKLFISFLLFYTTHVIAAESQQTVPDYFQGKWSADAKNCTNDFSSSLIIEANHIQFAESKGAIKAIVTQGKLELALISELSGEGETWLDYKHFKLSEDKQTLSDITNQDLIFTRYKCKNM